MPQFQPRRICSGGRAVAALAFACALLADGAGAEDRAEDALAIRAAGKAYQEALQRGDGKALAALWTADGDIVDDAGRVFRGRESVALLEPDGAAGDRRPPQLKITITETAIRFVAADVAIEDGTVRVVPPGGGALEGRFSATWVREAGAWKLAALREARGGPAGPEALADLDWMVGDWVAVEETDGKPVAGGPRIEVSARWNPTRTFLLRDMTITPPGGAAAGSLQFTQRIGWDPLSRSIRSWVFGSDGSHGEAAWSRDDGSWVARTTAIHADGTQTASINIYTYDGKDRCGWRSLPTHVGSEHQPPVDMTLVRVPRDAKPQGAGR